MKRVLIALIINRNRYLICRITSGALAGRWAFPSGLVNTAATDFETIKTEVQERLGIEIFPYLSVKELAYKTPDSLIPLTLIKCSIRDDAKTTFSVNVPSKYRWISLPFVAHIDFAPRDKKIVRHLTNGLLLVPPKRIRRSASKRKTMPAAKTAGNRGFASMDKARLFEITSAAGKAAHRMGRAHKWTPETASRAGKLGAKATWSRHG
jgi:uncharacterized protein